MRKIKSILILILINLIFSNVIFSQKKELRVLINPNSQFLLEGELISEIQFLTECWNEIFNFDKFYEESLELNVFLEYVQSQKKSSEIILVYNEEHKLEELKLFANNLEFSLNKMREWVIKYIKLENSVNEFSFKVAMEKYVMPKDLIVPPPPILEIIEDEDEKSNSIIESKNEYGKIFLLTNSIDENLFRKFIINNYTKEKIEYLLATEFGQTNETYKENLNKNFIEYNDLFLKQDFEKSMDYMLPDLFEIIPKNQMILLMKQAYNNPDLELKIDKPKEIVYGEPKEIEGKYYSEITYSYDIKMKFNNIKESEDEEQKKLTRNLKKLQLEKKFGSENVKFNEETEFYEIKSVKNALGISENRKSDWKFVIVKRKQKFILEKFLPKELTDKL